MCGIVGAVTKRDSVAILLAGLARLEYRGYDSAGIAMLDQNCIFRTRVKGKVKELEQLTNSKNLKGTIGIAHTRWATHGKPNEKNAHPHLSNQDKVAVVHNGIIENHQQLRNKLSDDGFIFSSKTDTEVVVHQIQKHLNDNKDLLTATQDSIAQIKGAYGLGIISTDNKYLIAARYGSPLVIGVGIGENYIASDVSALLAVTNQFIYLKDGDVAKISTDKIEIYNSKRELVTRKIKQSNLTQSSYDKGEYRHFMEKEIHEQAQAIADTLQGRIAADTVLDGIFGNKAKKIFAKTQRIQAIACGTSYNAGLVAKYWCEKLLSLPFNIEVASEYRYRNTVVEANTLFVAISQSGETADTLAAINKMRKKHKILSICNVAESSITRVSDLQFLTHAGPEIGVASTKAFTTQLVALLLLILAINKEKKIFSNKKSQNIIAELRELPRMISDTLKLAPMIEKMAINFSDKNHALFLGRGIMYPIALEGSLKLKEISYIHAEAYPAGELKHGPLALVDEEMPVVAVAPDNELLDKLQSNLEEVRARGGVLYVLSDKANIYQETDKIKAISTDVKSKITAPIIFTIPLQLLSYFVALVKGTDIDQPRNLAKSVTVE